MSDCDTMDLSSSLLLPCSSPPQTFPFLSHRLLSCVWCALCFVRPLSYQQRVSSTNSPCSHWMMFDIRTGREQRFYTGSAGVSFCLSSGHCTRSLHSLLILFGQFVRVFNCLRSFLCSQQRWHFAFLTRYAPCVPPHYTVPCRHPSTHPRSSFPHPGHNWFALCAGVIRSAADNVQLLCRCHLTPGGPGLCVSFVGIVH